MGIIRHRRALAEERAASEDIKVASDPKTSPADLDRYSRSKNPYVVVAAVSNPNILPETLARVAGEYSAPNLYKKNNQLINFDITRILAPIARHPNTNMMTQLFLLDSSHEAVKMALLSRENVEREIVDALTSDRSRTVCNAALEVIADDIESMLDPIKRARGPREFLEMLKGRRRK